MPNKLESLMRAITSLKTSEEATQFFTDLCTPSELEAMADRWLVVPFLTRGVPYREIHQRTGVSVATITRVARAMNFGTGGYALIHKRQNLLP